MKVKNKTIIVTGGGNGMGRELTLALLTRGARVIAIDMNEEALQETRSLWCGKGNMLATLVADITQRASLEILIEKAIAQYDGVDGIINNAGIIQPFLKLNDLGFDAIERVFNVNFFGTLYMTKLLLPHLLIRPEAHIINVSSMGGFLPVPGQSIYGASKAAVKLMTEGLCSELSETNVHVSVVFPGAVRTDIKAHSGLGKEGGETSANSKKKILLPSEAAQIIINGMEHNHRRIFVGKDCKSMDLMYRIHPQTASGLIYNKMKDKI